VKYLAITFSTLLILVAVLLPGSQVPDVGITGIDKLAHITLFGIWITAVRYDFQNEFNWLWALAVGLGFSVLTEVLQILVEGRTFDLTDIVADMVGLVLGLFAGKLVIKWLNRIID
jgi:VanZ family protein